MADDDGYTSEPTHLRLYYETETGWGIDGADDAGHYTEAVWYAYTTAAQAARAIPAFIEETKRSGVVWKWRNHRSAVPMRAQGRGYEV